MSLAPDSDQFGELCCDQCHFKKFPTKNEYKLHYLAHKSEPTVKLVRLSQYSLGKLKHHSYRVNNGVARRTKHHVSPLKISLKKQKGTTQFEVIRKKPSREKVGGLSGEDSRRENEILKPKTESSANVEVNLGKRDVEGNNLLERFGANISITRKSSGLPVQQIRDESELRLDDNDNVNKEISGKLSQDEVLERLLTSGISVAKQNSILEPSTEGTKVPKIVNVFSTTNAEEVKKDQNAEDEKKTNKTLILKKLSDLGFTLVPKTSNRADIDEQTTANDSAEKENKLQKTHVVKSADLQIYLNSKNGSESASGETKKNLRSDSVNGKESSGKADERSTCSVKKVEYGTEEGNGKHSDSGMQVPKKHVRVKNSKVSKKNLETERRDSLKEDEGDEEHKTNMVDGWPASGSSEDAEDNLDDLKQKLPMNTVLNPEDKRNDARMGVSSSPTEQLTQDFMVSKTGSTSPTLSHPESQFVNSEQSLNRPQGESDCTVLLGSSPHGEENGESSRFSDDGFRPESFSEENNGPDAPGDEVAVAFSTLQNEDQSIDQPQQDPLMTPESTQSNGESLNQNFLHNFLNDSQPSQTNIQPEGSEFMALERLGQVSGLDGQSNFDINSSDPSTPMEQLSQQVQRLPNPPQINVIPQHQMQAPQPPQLHAGLPPMSQQSNSFDTLSHIQPPMPPPLYQGYNMYNQNFPTQGPQQLPPRPPMMPQRPQIQARPFQAMAAPRPRHRSYTMKRNAVRMSSPPDVPQKQRRMDANMQARTQAANLNPTPKIPSGITVTPSKKNLDASKVANVLASRGITVTPSPARQPSPANRSQPRSNPVLNIGPGVSITTNSSRGSGGSFAVPSPRKSSPIVNTDVERPERCATVDLTLDDDPPPQMKSRSGLRFPCNQCTIVFPTAAALEAHKASHRTAGTLPFKCDKCTAQYPNAQGLQHHRAMFHKSKLAPPELAIPIVDLNHPGARDQLAKCGVHGFLPLSQLQGNSLGYFGVPVIHLDSTKEKAITNLNTLGAANVLVLGKMKTLVPPSIR